MTPPAPWSPTAHAFAQHQFSHVVNFWKQGRQASLRLEALPGGRAELNVTFQLPPPSEVIPPPSYPGPTQQRPIHPLFPGGFSPQGHASGLKPKPATEKKLSSKQRKSYRRSVLHRAALAVPSLPTPKDGSLRHAALASVQQLQAASASAVGANKRPFPSSPNSLSPSNLPPLSQRIRKDIQIGESEVESPEKEILRSPSFLENSPPLNPPHYVQGVPPPAPLFFTPPKSHERSEMPANTAEEVSAKKVVPLFTPPMSLTLSCVNCDAEMAPDHQCKLVEPTEGALEEGAAVGKSDQEDVENPQWSYVSYCRDLYHGHGHRCTMCSAGWTLILEKRTNDSALKSRLLESLKEAIVDTPVSVLSDEDLDAVKDRFLDGVITPVRFLDELQNLLKFAKM